MELLYSFDERLYYGMNGPDKEAYWEACEMKHGSFGASGIQTDRFDHKSVTSVCKVISRCQVLATLICLHQWSAGQRFSFC